MSDTALLTSDLRNCDADSIHHKPEIWRRIQAYPIDDPDSSLNFSRRLAREQHGWSAEYAKRVVEEYRRFVYLSQVSTHPVTPSDEVDQAWHLHILYMQSYEEFCKECFARVLYHGPTKGGAKEIARFDEQYNKTLALYRTVFKEEPPQDIWPEASVRFGNAENLCWVDSSQYFILSRENIERNGKMIGRTMMLIAALLLCLFCLTGCSQAFADETSNASKPLAAEAEMNVDHDAEEEGEFPVVLVLVGVFVSGLIIFAICSASAESNRRRKNGGGSSGNSGGDSGCGSFFFGIFDGGGCSSGDAGCGGGGCGGGGCGGCGGCGG